MEELLQLQQVANSRLLRIENKSIEVRNALQHIYESISSVAENSLALRNLMDVSVNSSVPPENQLSTEVFSEQQNYLVESQETQFADLSEILKSGITNILKALRALYDNTSKIIDNLTGDAKQDVGDIIEGELIDALPAPAPLALEDKSKPLLLQDLSADSKEVGPDVAPSSGLGFGGLSSGGFSGFGGFGGGGEDIEDAEVIEEPLEAEFIGEEPLPVEVEEPIEAELVDEEPLPIVDVGEDVLPVEVEEPIEASLVDEEPLIDLEEPIEAELVEPSTDLEEIAPITALAEDDAIDAESTIVPDADAVTEEEREAIDLENEKVRLLQEIADNTAGMSSDAIKDDKPEEEGTKSLFDKIGESISGFFGGGALKKLSPIAIIGSLFSGLKDAFDEYDPEKDLMENIPNVIRAFFGGVLEFLTLGIFGRKEVDALFDTLEMLMLDYVITPVMDAFNWIADKFAGVVDFVSRNVIEPIMNGFLWIGEQVTKTMEWFNTSVITPIMNGFSWMGQQITNTVNWFNTSVIAPIMAGFTWIGEQFTNITNFIATSVVEPIMNGFTWLAETLVALPEMVNTNLIQPITDFFGGIGAKFGELQAWFAEFDLVKSISDGISGVITSIEEQINSFFEWLSESVFGKILKKLGIDFSQDAEKVKDGVVSSVEESKEGGDKKTRGDVSSEDVEDEEEGGIISGAADTASGVFSGVSDWFSSSPETTNTTNAEVANGLSGEVAQQKGGATVINNYNNYNNTTNAPTSNVTAGKPTSNNSLPPVGN